MFTGMAETVTGRSAIIKVDSSSNIEMKLLLTNIVFGLFCLLLFFYFFVFGEVNRKWGTDRFGAFFAKVNRDKEMGLYLINKLCVH